MYQSNPAVPIPPGQPWCISQLSPIGQKVVVSFPTIEQKVVVYIPNLGLEKKETMSVN